MLSLTYKQSALSLKPQILMADLYGPFPPNLLLFKTTSSQFAIHGDSIGDPYLDLCFGISQHSIVGEVILLGDFNALT